MKKYLFAILVFVGFTVAAPLAEAGQFARVYNGRGVTYVHKSQLYSPYSYGYRKHRKYRHSRHHRHYRSHSYYRPHHYKHYRSRHVSYPYYSNYGYSRPYCHNSRPRVSIAFGF